MILILLIFLILPIVLPLLLLPQVGGGLGGHPEQPVLGGRWPGLALPRHGLLPLVCYSPWDAHSSDLFLITVKIRHDICSVNMLYIIQYILEDLPSLGFCI